MYNQIDQGSWLLQNIADLGSPEKFSVTFDNEAGYFSIQVENHKWYMFSFTPETLMEAYTGLKALILKDQGL